MLKDYPKDETSNVPENIENKIGRNLHLKKKHPLNTIKSNIEQFFLSKNKGTHTFQTFDNLK